MAIYIMPRCTPEVFAPVIGEELSDAPTSPAPGPRAGAGGGRRTIGCEIFLGVKDCTCFHLCGAWPQILYARGPGADLECLMDPTPYISG